MVCGGSLAPIGFIESSLEEKYINRCHQQAALHSTGNLVHGIQTPVEVFITTVTAFLKLSCRRSRDVHFKGVCGNLLGCHIAP